MTIQEGLAAELAHYKLAHFAGENNDALVAFRKHVIQEGVARYRDLPWRRTQDPYEIWISEVMLQQTQVSRVDGRWQAWLERFPNLFALAEASSADVLEEWMGMGYNRRALALLKCAQTLVNERDGIWPHEVKDLIALPGIGPSTAAGIKAFAFCEPANYLETNVRAVLLHELYPGVVDVPEKELKLMCEKVSPLEDAGLDNPRNWYYFLLDYGAYLKKVVPNPSRRARAYQKQSKFEGSKRQKRAEILRILLANRNESEEGMNFDAIYEALLDFEKKRSRTIGEAEVANLLAELCQEGSIKQAEGAWMI